MIDSSASTDTTNNLNAIFTYKISIDFLHGILMTSDNDRGFIDPKQENHIFIKEMLESIFLKSDIESCIVTIIDNVFHSASYLFFGA